MAQGLGEGPLAVDRHVLGTRRHPGDSLDGRCPHRLQPRPTRSEIGGIGRVQDRPFGVAPVELGRQEWRDLDTPDAQPVDLAVEVGAVQGHATNPHPAQVDQPK